MTESYCPPFPISSSVRERRDGQLKNADKEDPGKWWDEDMHDKSVRGLMERDLAPLLSPEQLGLLAGLFRDMLVFEPEERIPAPEVMKGLDSMSTMVFQPTSIADGVRDVCGWLSLQGVP